MHLRNNNAKIKQSKHKEKNGHVLNIWCKMPKFVLNFSPTSQILLVDEIFARYLNPWILHNISWPYHHILSVSDIMLSFSKMPLKLCCSEGRKKTPEVNHLLHFFHLKWLQKLCRGFLCFIKPVHKDQLYKDLWHADVNSHWCLHSWALKGIQSRKISNQEITADELKTKACLL